MGGRALLMASVASGVVLAGEPAYAQDESTTVHTLPPVEVTPAEGVKRGRSQSASRVARARPRVYIPTAPVSTSTSAAEVEADKIPASVNVVDSKQIERSGSLNIADALQQNVPGITINEVAGNPFQPDVQFRGFVASPVSGTPQGLAVYQNGVRINEAFGDTVNWDLIPTAAIRSVAVVTNNPAFGLNALGGAINVQMKDGFSYHGAEINTMGGSYGRIQSSAQWGKQVDNYAVYGALEGLHDDGFRNFSPSDVRRFYGDVGYRNDVNEFHLNMGVANNNFGATATAPVRVAAAVLGRDLHHAANLDQPGRLSQPDRQGRGDAELDHRRRGVLCACSISNTVDGNPTGTQPCADPTLLCFGDDTTPANGLNGAQLANPFAPDAVLGEIDRTTTHSTTAGMSLQATNTDQLFGHDNHFVVGASFDSSVTHFTASCRTRHHRPEFRRHRQRHLPRAVRRSRLDRPGRRCAPPINIPGIYALDTFDVTKAFSITAGGRFNDARIALEDQIGTALNGNQTFDRFNPIIGGTYKITPELTAYAGYSEANRAPTPLELGCADPAHPCIVAAFLVSDPPLKQVVSHTVEAGLRGSKELNIGTLGWKLGGFRATNTR